ncbi:MAG: SH3 domain-containing protein [Blautia sp.]|nr:SH3 domain-containing protein [Blautia sp.]
MLKRFVCILMTAAMAAGITASVNAEELGVVTADYLNVRDGASTADAIVGGLLNGAEVTINEVTDNGWCEIAYGNGSAFVSGEYVTTGGEAAASEPQADASGTSEEAEDAVVEDAASGDASAEEAKEEAGEETTDTASEENSTWDGPVLTPSAGVVYGPTGKETYYNLDMSGVVGIMRSMGNNDEYWVREDGVKMLGDYVMCAANLSVHPRGSLVESSLGTCIVCDTGGFAAANPNQLDIAVTW